MVKIRKKKTKQNMRILTIVTSFFFFSGKDQCRAVGKRECFGV